MTQKFDLGDRIEKLQELEASGRIRPQHQQELDRYRSNGQIKPTTGAAQLQGETPAVPPNAAHMTNKKKPPVTNWDPLDAALGKWVEKKPAAKPKPRTVPNASPAERIRRSGGLGFSPETKALMGANSKGVLGRLNRAAIGAVELPAKALQGAGHAAEWAATGLDNTMRSSGLAEALSVDGNQFLPASGLMALGEAIPLGASAAAGVLSSGRALAPRTASAANRARQIIPDQSGSVPIPKRRTVPKAAPVREPASFPKPALAAPRSAPRGALASDAPRIEGAPQRIRINGQLEEVGPSADLRQIAQRYAAEAGIDYADRYDPCGH